MDVNSLAFYCKGFYFLSSHSTLSNRYSAGSQHPHGKTFLSHQLETHLDTNEIKYYFYFTNFCVERKQKE